MKTFNNSTSLAIETLCTWLGNHAEQFRPSPGEGLNSFDHLKPLGEFILILYSFSGNSNKIAHQSAHTWAADMGNILEKPLSELCHNINWGKLPDCGIKNQFLLSSLLIFPAHNALTGKSLVPISTIARLLSSPNLALAIYTINLELAFAQDIAGLGSCHELMQSELILFLDKSGDKDLLNSEVYKLTHLIFFATKMGFRELALPQSYRPILKNKLTKALALKMKQQNFDLLSELLMCMNWINYTNLPIYEQALQYLSETIILNGCKALNIQMQSDNQCSNFRYIYHTALVALAALGHSPYHKY